MIMQSLRSLFLSQRILSRYLLLLHAEEKQRKDESWVRLGSKSQVVRIQHVMPIRFEFPALFFFMAHRKYCTPKLHSYFSAHNFEPRVSRPANCLWKIHVCLTIMHATSHSDLWRWPSLLHAQFLQGGTNISAFVPADKQNSPQCFWRGLTSGSCIYTHYTALDVLSLEWKCSDPY